MSMNQELITRMVKCQKEFAAIKEVCGIIAVDKDQIHLAGYCYREQLMTDDIDHQYEFQGPYIRVSCVVNGTNFIALFPPKIAGDLKDMI